MGSHPKLDRQSFEAFLANAFAVQKSGLDAQSLAAVADVQRFMESPEFALERALPLIAERALQASKASGIAIALLESMDLVYRAGSGSAAVEIGRRVPAVLTACTNSEGRPEILRVENAETDWRIQADICRQFGATSLLILPIYDRGAIAGVFQVHFNEAHSFLDREIRAYRLIAGLVEEALSLTRQREKETAQVASEAHATASQPTFTGDGFAQEETESHTLPPTVAPLPASATVATRAALLSSFTRSGIVRELARSIAGSARQISQKFYELIIADPWQVVAAVSVTLVLAIGVHIAHLRHSVSSQAVSTISSPSEIRQSLAPNPVSESVRRKTSSAEERDVLRPSTAFHKVRIGPDEVDYVAEDVTIRHFTTPPGRTRAGSGASRIDFGKDVTMRYFSNDSTMVSATTPAAATTQTSKPSPRSP